MEILSGGIFMKNMYNDKDFAEKVFLLEYCGYRYVGDRYSNGFNELNCSTISKMPINFIIEFLEYTQ
jgi:hypothetical protein